MAGDSIAGAFYASTQKTAFRGVLWDEMDVQPDGRLHFGFPYGRLSDFADEELPEAATLVIVEIGTNDFGVTPLAEFDDGYENFLSRLAAASPDATVVCLGVWHSASSRSNGSTPADYDELIAKNCEANSGTFVPLSPIYDTKGTRGPAGVETVRGLSDGFHPNDTGHAAIAQAILDAIDWAPA